MNVYQEGIKNDYLEHILNGKQNDYEINYNNCKVGDWVILYVEEPCTENGKWHKLLGIVTEEHRAEFSNSSPTYKVDKWRQQTIYRELHPDENMRLYYYYKEKIEKAKLEAEYEEKKSFDREVSEIIGDIDEGNYIDVLSFLDRRTGKSKITLAEYIEPHLNNFNPYIPRPTIDSVLGIYNEYERDPKYIEVRKNYIVVQAEAYKTLKERVKNILHSQEENK